MRFALLLALVIAVVAVVFASQNPDSMEVRLGPWLIGPYAKALVLLVTFALGTLVGLLAALPGRWAASRRAKKLEKEIHAAPTAATSLSPGIPEEKITKADPYTERFGPPPHQL